MKKIALYLTLCLCFILTIEAHGHPPLLNDNFEQEIVQILDTYAYEKQQLMVLEKSQIDNLQYQITALEYDMHHPESFSKQEYMNQYLELERIRKIKAEVELSAEMLNLQLRYKKGIDIIKLLYEKILGLDHHFSGMQTLQNILLLTNPNSYPEFRKSKEYLTKKENKKFNLMMPQLFESNVYLSATYSLISSFLGDGDRKDKENNMNQISCILDFTVRMHSELNIILHETEYLKNANSNLKEECESLFSSYVKVIDYLVPIDKCRQNDDWEKVHVLLSDYIEKSAGETDGQVNLQLSKNIVNLEFATERVAEFINKYIAFIEYGTQYYQKFDNIISTYQNQDICANDLPHQFTELKFDIKSTIDKFSNTYNMPELQGSRLKDLMHGRSN